MLRRRGGHPRGLRCGLPFRPGTAAARGRNGSGLIPVVARPEGRKVVLHAVEAGPGLSAGVRDRLFTPFTTDKPEGVGLGLVISRDIVAGFGGELSLEPTAAGAAFRIVLARAK